MIPIEGTSLSKYDLLKWLDFMSIYLFLYIHPSVEVRYLVTSQGERQFCGLLHEVDHMENWIETGDTCQVN